MRGLHLTLPGGCRPSGAATVEYLIVGLFVILALLGGPDVIHALWNALQKLYTAFYYAISAGV